MQSANGIAHPREDLTAMEIPVEIDFQGMSPDDAIRDTANGYIAELENRFGRITACRLVIRAPGGHHRTGGLFEINIHLTLPDGKEVVASRTPHRDERHSDLAFALHDAFKHARRQLQDQVRHLEGQVKTHIAPPIGIVARIDQGQGFGFIEDDDGREIYFHQNSVLDGKFGQLKPGMRVTFAEERGDKGPQASTVKLMGKHGLR
jgi:cold shock CspA family protein